MTQAHDEATDGLRARRVGKSAGVAVQVVELAGYGSGADRHQGACYHAVHCGAAGAGEQRTVDEEQ